MKTVNHSSIVRPCRGERVSGDATFIKEEEGGIFLAIVDGLGHGPNAHEAASRAVAFLRDAATPAVAELMVALDEHMRGSIGAAVGLCWVDLETGGLRYAGVGNTVIRRFGSSDSKLVSRAGVIGGRMRTPREETLTIQDGDVLLLHTDGVSERFGTLDYPEIMGHEVRLVASQVIKRFGKHHDDAGVVVARFRK